MRMLMQFDGRLWRPLRPWRGRWDMQATSLQQQEGPHGPHDNQSNSNERCTSRKWDKCRVAMGQQRGENANHEERLPMVSCTEVALQREQPCVFPKNKMCGHAWTVCVQEANQTARYPHVNAWTTTAQHFHDVPTNKEPAKRSTHGKLYQGSPFFTSTALQTKSAETQRHASTLKSTSDLDPRPAMRQTITNRTTPSSAYSGNGAFVVELPHSTITYPKQRMVGYDKIGWRTEYSEKFKERKPYSGYHVLTSRWTRPLGTTSNSQW